MRVFAAAAVCLLAAVAQAQHDIDGYVYGQHSVSHPYSSNGINIPNWDFQGSTVISDSCIRLTPDRQSKRGNLWNTIPWNPDRPDAGFEVHLEFQVHGQGTTLYGDGFALWYTAGIQPLGSVFGSGEQFLGLGVMFDTYSNMRGGHSQYISVMLSDPTNMAEYDHDKDGGDAKLAGCAVDFRGSKMEARLVYDNNMLRMYYARPDSPWEECFVVRKVSLPKGYHFGVSAATGDLADNHDIISLKVTDPQPMSAEELQELNDRIQRDVEAGVENMEHHDPQYEDGGSEGVGTPIPTYVSVGAIVLVIIFIGGFVFYTQRKQDYHAKHFT